MTPSRPSPPSIQDTVRGMTGKVYWNGAEAATLSSMDYGLIAIQMPSLHKGHHSIFAQLVCNGACPYPVNGSVFFAASASPPGAAATRSISSDVLPDAGQTASVEALGRLRHLSCTQADVQTFLPARFHSSRSSLGLAGQRKQGGGAHTHSAEMERHTKRKAYPSDKELCSALATLHKELWQAVEEHHRDPSSWVNLARWLVSRGRVHEAIGIYQSALRVFARSKTREQVHVRK